MMLSQILALRAIQTQNFKNVTKPQFIFEIVL